MKMRTLDNANWWHERAEETRTVAEGMNTPELKDQMNRIADGYDRMEFYAQHRQHLAQSRANSSAARGTRFPSAVEGPGQR